MANIRIQSSKTITVTSGLQHQDFSTPDAHIPDRLKVSPSWPKRSVQIVRGVGVYPAEIKDWKTVKALVKDGILTIGAITEESVTNKVEEKRVSNLVSENAPKKRKSLEELSK